MLSDDVLSAFLKLPKLLAVLCSTLLYRENVTMQYLKNN